MVKNLRLRIKVEFEETEAEPSEERSSEEQRDGSLSLVLPAADELNISALDRAALDVSDLMCRSRRCERRCHGIWPRRVKKTPEPSPGTEGGAGGTGTVGQLSGRRGSGAV